MGTRSSKPATLAGVDVSAKELVVALSRRRGEHHLLTIPNTTEGHKTLLRALRKAAGTARVTLEATGTYHLDLALALAAHPQVEVMVVNPLAARRFAQAQMVRSKTDKVDAEVLLEFCGRMPFEAWTAPSPAALELRAVTRLLATLIADQTAIKNRREASCATASTPAFVLAEIDGQLAEIAKRITSCESEATRIAGADPELAARVASLVSLPGIGVRSGVQLLGELVGLDATMTADEVVAYAGLDPRPRQSGIKDPVRKISKVGNARVRAILYLPAVTAARSNRAVQTWYEALRGRGKPAFVAHVAVMRRLLRTAWTVMVRKTTWDEQLFLPRVRSAANPPVDNSAASP